MPGRVALETRRRSSGASSSATGSPSSFWHDRTRSCASSRAWEHGIRLPKVGWHRSFPRFYQQMLDSLYEELGEEEFILPPELLAIVDSNRAVMVPFFRNYYAEVRKAWA
ncbi:hypothetical protein [Pyxidicoccus xibeiensis]|uniref:hypothetical protein n=1 Tax=Pyxidicoccus xibeiensis TaxID=2906759 RepID=UPI0020A738AF|nr:hypothetical protein [Pyxidicoccus xibeiensis]MCP3138176.1 hypothetical protein [Pyxidicoccus xibeiensis]